MADNTSLEQQIFTQSFDEIVTVLSSNLTDIASKLVAKGLIPQGLYDNIVYPVPGITEKQRAGQVVQCNLDYPDLVYPDPRLSGLAGDQILHYHACAEGVTNDILWVWSQVER